MTHAYNPIVNYSDRNPLDENLHKLAENLRTRIILRTQLVNSSENRIQSKIRHKRETNSNQKPPPQQNFPQNRSYLIRL